MRTLYGQVHTERNLGVVRFSFVGREAASAVFSQRAKEVRELRRRGTRVYETAAGTLLQVSVV